jgi:hypothetical protein
MSIDCARKIGKEFGKEFENEKNRDSDHLSWEKAQKKRGWASEGLKQRSRVEVRELERMVLSTFEVVRNASIRTRIRLASLESGTRTQGREM